MPLQENFLSLSELNDRIKNLLNDHFVQPIWVTAEIFSMNIHKSGHCYLELAEKSEKTNKILAKSKAVIWAYQFFTIRSYFEQTTGMPFSEGMKVLMKVSPNFHEQYGFSLIISDLDPSYTMGDLARQRLQTIQALQEAGVFGLNKEQNLPFLPKRLAVISSDTAAGYEDFLKQLAPVLNQFKIEIQLFTALMQGSDCPNSIIAAIEDVYELYENFDALIIIRGGGAKSDLSCFDDYSLALNVCHFPLPVITGIGHERDESVLDMVAHTRMKTPTAVAQFIIDRFLDSESLIAQYQEQLIRLIKNKIHLSQLELSKFESILFRKVYDSLGHEKNLLLRIESRVKNRISDVMLNQRLEIRQMEKMLAKESLMLVKNNLQNLEALEIDAKKHTFQFIDKVKKELGFLEQKVQLQNPENILKKGYSITTQNNRLITSVNQINMAQQINTVLPDGNLISNPAKVLPK